MKSKPRRLLPHSLIVGCLALVGLLASCNKTYEFEDIDLLIGKDWHLTSIQSDGVEISDSCDWDDVLRFREKGDFSHSIGDQWCFTGQNYDEEPISWKLTDDFTVLRMKYKLPRVDATGTKILYWEIMELSDTALVVKDALAEGNNQIPEFRTYR